MTIALCLKATDINTRQIGSNYQIEIPVGENTFCINFTPEALEEFTKDVADLMKHEMKVKKLSPHA